MSSVNWQIEYHDCLKSTQDVIRARVEAGASEGLVVQAGEQTAGQGRHGRVWESPPGNLYCSILLKPDCGIQNIGQFALVAGLSVAHAVQAHIDKPGAVSLKWPNDVLIGGEKCAGILIETDGRRHVMVGIGLNVKNAPVGGGTALALHSRRPVPNPADILPGLLDIIGRHYAAWIVGDFDKIRRSWLALAHKAGTPVSVKIGTMHHEGTFQDVDTTGALRIRDADGIIRTITAGDVFIQLPDHENHTKK